MVSNNSTIHIWCVLGNRLTIKRANRNDSTDPKSIGQWGFQCRSWVHQSSLLYIVVPLLMSSFLKSFKPIRSNCMDNGTRWMARNHCIYLRVSNEIQNEISSFAFSSRSSLFEASSIDETILEEDVFESQNYEIKYKQPSYFAILISYIDNARPIRRILWFIFSKVLLE